MSQIQQGRAKAKRVFRKPKTFEKARKTYSETFNDSNKVAAATKEYMPKYSRVTKKIISKTTKK